MNNPSRNSVATRGTLLSKIKDCGNQESWREFYSIYKPLIYGLARKMGLTDAEAQDAVQESFSHVSKNISKFHYDPKVGSFKSWLFKTSRWHINDQFRRRPKDCEPLHRDSGTGRQTSTAERIPDPRGNLLERLYEDDWKQNLRDAALQRVKERVKPKQYQAFYLHAVEAMPMDEITRLLGVTRNQVYLAKGRITRLVAAEAQRLDREIV
ncbi:MAG: sigma-70 family RNA polymerase sigma factor [Pedosphaera sp.]|nr:sigma-70 family RNA polymerase sigma factor [Pedosphaera sp.]